MGKVSPNTVESEKLKVLAATSLRLKTLNDNP